MDFLVFLHAFEQLRTSLHGDGVRFPQQSQEIRFYLAAHVTLAVGLGFPLHKDLLVLSSCSGVCSGVVFTGDHEFRIEHSVCGSM